MSDVERPPNKITHRDREEARKIVGEELHRTSNPDEVENLLNELSLPTDVPEEPEEQKPQEVDESEFPF